MTTSLRHLNPEFVASYADRSPDWGFGGMGEVVYLRTYSRDVPTPGGEVRKERWHETVERCVNGALAIGADLSGDEAERLFDHVWNLRCSFSGRSLWQLGTPLVKRIGGASLINCYVTSMGTIEDFEFLMDHLMVGGGVGFTLERSRIHDLPVVKSGVEVSHVRSNDADVIVPDKREGWSRLLHSVLKSYFYTGKSFTYSTILIRSAGSPLQSFGGTASGPQALIDGIEDICKVLKARAGKKMRSVDVLDLCNIIGRIVVAGSARRSAQIATGDPDDYLFLEAKNWGKWDVPGWRANSNNSVLCDSYDEIIGKVWEGYDGSGEPYGFVNRNLMRAVGRLGEASEDRQVISVNPCGEIGLEDGECCNLSTIFLPKVETLEQLLDCSRLLYRVQKAITFLDYPYEKTREVVYRNRRLGQSVTGVLQSTPQQLSWLDRAYRELKAEDDRWSDEHGCSRSIKLTTVQPSGSLSLLPGVTPGIHPAFARYYVRRVRFGVGDPLVDACRKRGYPAVPDVGIDGRVDHSRWVVEFPCEAPEGTVLAADMTAVQQLEWVRRLQREWADNAVSVTVYYRKEELPAIKAWLADHYESEIKSVSFLLHSDHGFKLAPYEEISEEEYLRRLAVVDMTVPLLPESTGDLIEDDCAGGACPIR